jgi:hypothetical protein
MSHSFKLMTTWPRTEIENAIADFVRDGVWPSLEYRECLHLLFRLHVAQKLIVAVLSNTAQAKAIAPRCWISKTLAFYSVVPSASLEYGRQGIFEHDVG